MAKISLTVEQILAFALRGLKDGNVEAVINLLQEYHDAIRLDRESKETNPKGTSWQEPHEQHE